MKSEICIVVAVAKNGIIGGENQLVWVLPADLKHFKEVTLGFPIIMGRKTYQSIGRPLPGRQNIVITRDTNFIAPGCKIVNSLEEAMNAASQSNPQKICIIGGGQIFELALPYVNKMYLTEVDAEPKGDIYFNFNREDWAEIASEHHLSDEKNPYNYRFVELIRH